jgi:S-adenosylmethionine synthetase
VPTPGARPAGRSRRPSRSTRWTSPARGIGGVYLSLLGTSAEDADSGQVGRGNRVNGLIALQRPAPAEAAAGKNPVSHVGKIYNVLAHRAAQRAHAEIGGLRDVCVWLCSQIGAPVDQPRLAAAQVVLADGVELEDVRGRVAAIVEDELARIPALTEELLAGQHPVY